MPNPTTTAAATTTLPPTTTTTAPQKLFQGRGDDVVDIGPNNDRLYLIASHDGRSNFIVHGLNADLQQVEGIVNEIGPFVGTMPLISYGLASDVRYLEVQADGNWSLELVGLERLPSVTDPTFGGAGTQVVLYMGDGGIFSVTHDGSSNFIVHVITADNTDGLINEIGPYSGRKPIPSGPALIEVTADGSWTFTK